MKGYLIADLTVTDPAQFEEYRTRVPAVVAQYGGRYLIRGGAVTTKEGPPREGRVVVLEFPSPAAAEQFYSSSEYAPLLALRIGATQSRVALVEGAAE